VVRFYRLALVPHRSPSRPNFSLEAYALAAEFELEGLTLAAPARMIHISIRLTPAELALQMGAVHLIG
jgi:hypothetical protein